MFLNEIQAGRVEEDPEREVRARVCRILGTAGGEAGGNVETGNGNEEVKIGGRRKEIERGDFTLKLISFENVFIPFY